MRVHIKDRNHQYEHTYTPQRIKRGSDLKFWGNPQNPRSARPANVDTDEFFSQYLGYWVLLVCQLENHATTDCVSLRLRTPPLTTL